jgi:hypothetical protein
VSYVEPNHVIEPNHLGSGLVARLYELCGLILDNRAVHLPFINMAERVAKYGSNADFLLLSTIQTAFICLIPRRIPAFTISVTNL